VRILHLTADWKWTGPAEPMLHAVTGLRERGHRVDAAFPLPPDHQGGGLLERARDRGVEPLLRLVRRQGWWPLRDRGEVRRLRGLLERMQYDVVHVHHTRDHILARLALRGLPTRLVVSWHDGEPIPARPWNRWLLGPRGAAGLVVLGERVAQAARAQLGWPAERIAIVPGCVDPERYSPREPSQRLRGEFGLHGEERVIGVVARLQPHRRMELLLEAFERARRSAPALRLLVVGRGTRAREVLEEPVAQRGLSHVVLRAGYRGEDYREVLALFDALAFVVPGSDGSCRAVLEAMAQEIPVIASQRGILPETVVDGESGRVIPEDPDLWADAFVELWREPERWRARGKAARRRVLEHHTPALAAERLEQFYERIVSSPAPKSGA
jgi:glycosyltransferase involved in cell wall biosynthesis